MRHLTAATTPRVVLFSLALTAIVSTAHADPISASYTVTNLGTGAITITAANGNTVPVDDGAPKAILPPCCRPPQTADKSYMSPTDRWLIRSRLRRPRR